MLVNIIQGFEYFFGHFSLSFVIFSAESHAKNSEEIFRIAFGPNHPLVSKSKQMQLEIQYKKQFCIKDESVASCTKKQQH
jgi:hypothetical protein